MAWNLHLTGQALETDLEEVILKLVDDLEAIGHKLTGATLTTDAGQTELPTQPIEEPVHTVGGQPVVTPAPTPPQPAPKTDETIAVTGPVIPTDTPPAPLADDGVSS